MYLYIYNGLITQSALSSERNSTERVSSRNSKTGGADTFY